VLGQVADSLAAEFAIGGNLPLETVLMTISGIVSVEAYGDVQRKLDNLSIIERYAITEVSGDRISYRVEARGGRDRLSRALRFAGLLEQDFPDPSRPEATLEFFYSP
jgi:uncharacterized protein